MGKSKFTTIFLISSDSELWDTIKKFKEYSPSQIFFSKKKRKLTTTKFSSFQLCSLLYGVQISNTDSQLVFLFFKMRGIYFSHIHKAILKLNTQYAQALLYIFKQGIPQAAMQKKHSEIWMNQLTQASSETSEQELQNASSRVLRCWYWATDSKQNTLYYSVKNT